MTETRGIDPDPRATRASKVRVLGRVPALDGVRGIAVLLVLVTHTMLVFVPTRFHDVVPGGFLGVDLFFVLSGFLITALLLGEHAVTGRIGLGAFYRRRALRLLPALVALLLVHFAYTVLTGLPIRSELHSIGVTMLYMANWYSVTGHRLAPGLAHLWSLSVEEQFYLVWPIVTLALLATRRTLRFVVVLLCLMIVALALWRTVLWQGGANAVARVGLRTDTRADGLLLGALGAYVWSWGTLPRRLLMTVASGATVFLVVCVTLIPPEGSFYPEGGYTLVAFAATAIVLAAVDTTWALIPTLRWRPLRSIGRVSYGVYLWHLPVFFAVRRYAEGWSTAEEIIAAWAITAGVTVLSWYFVEQPFLRRKRPAIEVRTTAT